MKIKNNLFFSFIFTFSLIAFIFWNRLIRVRLPKDLTILPVNYYTSIIITMLALFFFSLTIYYFLKYFKIIPRENSKFITILNKINENLQQYSWFNSFTEFCYNHIYNGPINVYEYFYARIDIRRIVSRMQEFALYRLNNNKELIYLFIFVIIRISIAFVFIFEVIIFKYIIHFYHLLILLLIPLITRFLLFFIQHNAMRNIELMEDLFDLSYREEDDTVVVKDKKLTELALIEEQQEADQRYVGGLWFFYQEIYNFVLEFNTLIEKDKYLLNIIYYGLMFTGFFYWAYLIYY